MKSAACRDEVLLLDNEIVFNEAIIEEREQGIQEIQQQISEVNEIFKDLAVLVHDQGVLIGKTNTLLFVNVFSRVSLKDTLTQLCTMLKTQSFSDDIGSNIANSHAATTQATSQLAKASKLQKSSSSLVSFGSLHVLHFAKVF